MTAQLFRIRHTRRTYLDLGPVEGDKHLILGDANDMGSERVTRGEVPPPEIVVPAEKLARVVARLGRKTWEGLIAKGWIIVSSGDSPTIPTVPAAA